MEEDLEQGAETVRHVEPILPDEAVQDVEEVNDQVESVVDGVRVESLKALPVSLNISNAVEEHADLANVIKIDQ